MAYNPNETLLWLSLAEANIIDRYRADRAVAAAVVHLTKIWLADLHRALSYALRYLPTELENEVISYMMQKLQK